MPTRGEIDRLGDALRDTADADALRRYSEYREALRLPLQEVAQRVRATLPEYTVVVRRKTAESTIAKLRRTPRMRLSRMQDTAGCRFTVPTLADQARIEGHI